MTTIMDALEVAESERDEARRAAEVQAAEIARLRAQVEAYEHQVVAVRVDRAEAIGLTRVTADEARAVAARYDELAGEILKLGTQLEAALAELSQARAELDKALRDRDAQKKTKEANGVVLSATLFACDRLTEERDAAIKHAERLGEEVARLKAEDERAAEHLREMLRKVDEEQNGMAICSWCALPTNSDEASKHTHQMTCPKSPIAALLGSAVAALQWAMSGLPANKRVTPEWANAYAIIFEPTVTAAVDAYRAQREERVELDAAVGALYRGEWASNDERDELINAAWAAVKAMWPKVDARRGGGR